MRALGHVVTFISWGGKPRSSDIGIDGKYYYQGFSYVNTGDIDVKRKNPLLRIFHHFFDGKKSIGLVKQMIGNVDVVVGYNPSMAFTNKMLTICKIHNIPFVSDITEWFDPREFPGGKFAPPSWINEFNMRFTQKRVKNKIVISSFLNRYYKSSNNVILPPLVDKNEEKWNNLKRVLPNYNGVRLIYAGTPSRKELFGTMLVAIVLAVKNGLQIQFVVLGISMEDILQYAYIPEIIALPSNFVFCGTVKQVDVPSYYNESDFSIIIREPTRKNMAGFPTKLAESLMAGCPVISNFTSDIAKYIQNGNNGIAVPDWSVNELHKVLLKIVTLTKIEKDEMKTNAKRSALEKFTFTNYIGLMDSFDKKIKT